MKPWIYFMGGTLLCASLTHANCGLDYCPRVEGEKPATQSASVLVKNVAFDLDSGSGDYQEIQPRYEYTGVPHWVFGGTLPVMALTVHTRTPPTGSRTDYGFSNPLLYASWYTHINRLVMLYAGLQLELPLGNFDAGMAGDHFMLVPYAQIEQSFGAGYIIGSIGYSRAYSVSDEEHVLYVNPHEDEEFQYRFGMGLAILENELVLQGFLSGRYALVDELEGPGRAHATGGISLAYSLGSYLLTPTVELPLNSPKRFDWSGGLEIKRLF